MARAKLKRKSNSGSGGDDRTVAWIRHYLAAPWKEFNLCPGNFLEQIPNPELRYAYEAECRETLYRLFGFFGGHPNGKRPRGTVCHRDDFLTTVLTPRLNTLESFVSYIPNLAPYCKVVPQGAVLHINDFANYTLELEKARARWWIANALPLKAVEREFVTAHLPELMSAARRCPKENKEPEK